MTEFVNNIWRWVSDLPSALGAPLILLVGWAIAKILKLIMPKILAVLKFDVLAGKIGVNEFLRKGHVQYAPSKLIGVFLYWVVMLLVLAMAASVLDQRAAESIWSWLFGAIPTILAAGITAAIGVLIVNFLSNFVLTIMNNAGMGSATLVQRLIRAVGYIIVVVMVVDQLGLGQSIVSILLLLLIGSIALGIAIAIGLGCKDMARQYVESLIRAIRERERASHGTDLEG
ncbi:MAG: hypothetical protein RDU47_04985 [Spirochaetia bacterium]|jgi:MFS family permease|uniref:Uncharacterized protein n=1 Tax=uncultured spirochete TaxID=156406 RepID=A0A3P3XID7_9SPIR|nr:hypothetical protein [Rectinema subterraneum]MDQ7796116.1 hypothetical protein [Spirochaetia bacterium]SLM12730.1 conserved membrane hypothetical protein [uncultured spirochete]HBE46580.1 hypothetical protein [Spirochaetaceae bacterium]HCX96525.1 hypothetical protein [Spirochaetaceae bacterium]